MKWYGRKRAMKLPKLDKKKIIVLDTETTGLNRGNDEILQITILDGNGIRLFSSYIKPSRKKSWKRAEKVNHITPEMVKNAPTFSAVRAEIQKILDQANIIVGYNISFDIGFLENSGVVVTANTFDVMYEYANFRKNVDGTTYRRYKLKDCAEYYSYSYIEHDSESDTEATLYCFNQLIGDSRFTSNATGQGTDENTHFKKRILNTSILTFPKIGMTSIGIMCFSIGELLYYYLGQGFIRSITQYLELITNCIKYFAGYETIHTAVILIAIGAIFIVVGLIKWLIRFPKCVLSRIRRIWSNIQSFF